jgi:hypothetical protein
MFGFNKFSTSFSFFILSILMFSPAVLAQSPVTGNWTAEPSDSSDKIQLSFEIKRERGRNVNSQSFSYSELNGLSSANARGGSASFSILRDAGNIQCSGSFKDGRGSGTFIFTPDQGYVAAMKARGFDFLKKDDDDDRDRSGERLFMAAMLNVKVALADDLRSANFGDLDVGDLFKATIFKIDGAYMAEMKATGFPNLSMEDLVKARIFKIDANYVRGISNAGMPVGEFEDLVKYAIFKVTPEYLGDLRNAGLVDLSAADIVKLRIFHIDANYVRDAKAANPAITVKEIVKKKIKVPEIPDLDLVLDQDED